MKVMKKRPIAYIVLALIIIVVALGGLTVAGVISKMTWAAFLLGFLGEDVEVEDVSVDAEQFEYHGLQIPDGIWETSIDDGLIIENETALVGIKVIEDEGPYPDGYLEQKALELSTDMNLNGIGSYTEEYTMCGMDAQSVVAHTDDLKYLIIFWSDGADIYTLSAIYTNRIDVDEVLCAISCQQ